MTPDEALKALAEAVELTHHTQVATQAGRAILELAVRVTRSRSGFLAQVEGDGLRWVLGLGADGRPTDLAPRQLARVASGVRESLDGVMEAPPSMTGGRAPGGRWRSARLPAPRSVRPGRAPPAAAGPRPCGA